MAKPLRRKAKAHRVRTVDVGGGDLKLPKLRDELDYMTDVLMGREDSPVERGTLTLMEVADAYYARATEITLLIQRGEVDGHILTTSALSKFRKGELRTFREMAKSAAELGSRRLTQEQILWDKERYGRDSA